MDRESRLTVSFGLQWTADIMKVKLRSRKLSNFELDRQLYEAINEFNSYKLNDEKLTIKNILALDQEIKEKIKKEYL